MIKLADITECTGCGACAQICSNNCIEMMEDEFGFKYPKIITTKCVECENCQNTCPVLQNRATVKTSASIYVAFSLDDETRKCSSSGGVFSELAKSCLASGGCVWGAAYDEDFTVRHICIDNICDLNRIRGAKYAQSELGNSFSTIRHQLASKRNVIFCGTPCQVAGLKRYLGSETPHLMCIDFVCHSVPSPMAWHAYVNYRSQVDTPSCHKPIMINLRSKQSGWSYYQYSAVFQYRKREYSMISSNDPYLRLFVNGALSRDSCSNCKFKSSNRYSDITLGDAWGVWDYAPEMDDNKGTSLVIVNTGIGEKYLKEIEQHLIIKQINEAEAFRMNPAYLCSKEKDSKRETILEEIKNRGYKKYENLLKQQTIKKKIILLAKKALGKSR